MNAHVSNVYEFQRGRIPLLVSVPHAGTEVPADIAARFTNTARELPDTDWYVDRLYGFVRDLGASIIKANYSRYVVDENRAPDSAPLYARDPASPVCATRTFGGEPIYESGAEPDAAEIARRVATYWQPYHSRIGQELQDMRAQHGGALLWDAHSIASEVPGLFTGVLPEFNFGTRDDESCPRQVADALLELVTTDGRFGAVLNGRFKGGYITLHHGRPAERIYAVQLELAQRTYMEEHPRGAWDAQRAAGAAELISRLLARYVKSMT